MWRECSEIFDRCTVNPFSSCLTSLYLTHYHPEYLLLHVYISGHIATHFLKYDRKGVCDGLLLIIPSLFIKSDCSLVKLLKSSGNLVQTVMYIPLGSLVRLLGNFATCMFVGQCNRAFKVPELGGTNAIRTKFRCPGIWTGIVLPVIIDREVSIF